MKHFKILFLSFLFAYSIIASSKYTVKSINSEDGTRINYILEGEGETALIFIHGWSCDKLYWKNQIDVFSKDFSVVALDLAGHGDSGFERLDYTMQAFGKDVAAVVKQHDFQKIILIGHSMGGAVSIEAANILGDRVIGIIGVDTFHDLSAVYTEEQKIEYILPMEENFEENCRAFVNSMFPSTADEELVSKIADDMSSAPKKVALSSFINLLDYDPIPSLENIYTPFISINASVFATNITANRSLTKSFHVKLMDEIGHFVMIEDPEKFNQLLNRSLTEIQ